MYFFWSDNETVVHILISRTSKFRCIVQFLYHLLSATVCFNFTFSVWHIPGIHNNITYTLFWFYWQEFKQLALGTQLHLVPALGALDSSALEAQCHDFLAQRLTSLTGSLYVSGLKMFYNLCIQLDMIHQSGSPYPKDEWTFNHEGLSVGSLLLAYRTGLSWSSYLMLEVAIGA